MTESDIYRRILVRMHADERVRALSRPEPSGKALWWELLAGEQTGIIPGLFKIGEAAFAEQLGWPIGADTSKGIAKGFREVFAEVSAQGLAKADWNARLVWLPSAIRHNPPASPNVVKHWKLAWSLLPECELKLEAWRTFKAFLEGKAKDFLEAFTKACPMPSLKASSNQGSGIRDQETDQRTLSAPSFSEPTAGQGKPDPAKEDPMPASPAPAEQIQARIAELEAGWQSTNGGLADLRKAIASTRKLGRMAPSVWLDFLERAEKYDRNIRVECSRVYLDKEYALEGKDEKYLLGIFRQEQERRARAPRGNHLRPVGAMPPPEALGDKHFDELERQHPDGKIPRPAPR